MFAHNVYVMDSKRKPLNPGSEMQRCSDTSFLRYTISCSVTYYNLRRNYARGAWPEQLPELPHLILARYSNLRPIQFSHTKLNSVALSTSHDRMSGFQSLGIGLGLRAFEPP